MGTHFDPAVSSRLAKQFAALRKTSDQSGNPLLVTNIWDVPSLNLALSNPKTVAVATASFAIAATHGLEDEELDAETNLAAISRIRKALIKSGKHTSLPLSVDIQDGYASVDDLDALQSFITRVIRLGVVGINIEDVVRTSFTTASSSDAKVEEELITPAQAGTRIRAIISTATALGVNDFVINARTDCVKLGGSVEEAIERGRLFLEAGATTVFVWGGGRGLRDEEVRLLVRGLEGRVAVIHKRGEAFLSIKEVKGLGVARISMGPGLWREGMAAVKKAMDETLDKHI